MNLVLELQQRSGDAVKGVIFPGNSGDRHILSYQDLYKAAVGALGYLQNQSALVGDEVIIQVEDNRDFLISFWACILGGMIPVPLSTGVQQEQKNKLFRVWDCLNNPLLVADPSHIRRLENLAAGRDGKFNDISRHVIPVGDLLCSAFTGIVADVNETDIAYLQFSSGSTGNPKGVVLTHENILCNVGDIITSLGIVPGDVLLSWMPLTHDMGMIGFHITGLVKGIDQVCMQTASFIRRPLSWMENAAAHKASVLYSPDFGLQYFLTALEKNSSLTFDLSLVRLIVNGAEPISAHLMKRFLFVLQSCNLTEYAFVAAYGLAEASVEVSCTPVDQPITFYCLDRRRLKVGDEILIVEEESGLGHEFADVGYPVAHCDVRICDDNEFILEENKIGHIQINGGNVTSGYYNNLPENKLLFTKDDWLRTGDMGFLRNKRLVITGRAKNIIIINGQNYYPQDIERIISENCHLESGRVVACGTPKNAFNQESLLIFILHKGNEKAFSVIREKVRSIITQNLGLYAREIIPVKSFPKTTSGKIRNFSLVEQYIRGDFDHLTESETREVNISDVHYAISGLQQLLTGIAKEIIGTAILENPNQNLFEAGLNSILAIQLANRINEALGCTISPATIFNYQTVEQLCHHLGPLVSSPLPAALTKGADSYILPVDQRGHFPLSVFQRRLWLLQEMEKENFSLNESMMFSLTGQIDQIAMEKAFTEMVARQQILRTVFVEVDEVPLQIVKDRKKLDIVFSDMALPDITSDDLSRTLTNFIRQPFELSNLPLFRVMVIKTAATKHLLCLVMHHIITDEWSRHLFIKEFSCLYNAAVLNHTVQLPGLHVHYSDYSVWINTKIAGNIYNAGKLYWKSQFTDTVPVLNLPYSYSKNIDSPSAPSCVTYKMEQADLTGLLQLCQKEGITLFVILLTAVYKLLHDYTGQEDFTLGVPVSVREDATVNNLMGFFVNLLPIRLKSGLFGQPGSLLQYVKKQFLNGLQHRLYPFDEIISEIPFQRLTGESPLFNVLVTYADNRKTGHIANMSLEGLEVNREPAICCNNKYKLEFYFEETLTGINCTILFDTRFFACNLVDKIPQHLQNICKAFHGESIQTNQISLLSEEEQDRMKFGFNRTAVAVTTQSVIERIALQVCARSSATAVIYQDIAISYSELDSRSEKIAAFLVNNCGFKRNDLVALVLDRSENMVAVILGVWKAGGTYVPLDPQLPQARLTALLEHLMPSAVITSGSYNHGNNTGNSNEKPFAGWWNVDTILAAPLNKIFSRVELPDIAYIMFTSGSTGVPKGVEVYMHSVANILEDVETRLKLKSGWKWLAVSTYVFDISVVELFLPLMTGGTLVMATTNDLLNSNSLKNLFDHHTPAVMQATPSLWIMLIDAGWQGSLDLKLVTCGEPLGLSLKAMLLQRSAEVWNMYGPTETTVFSTIGRVEEADEVITIGKPANNTRIYILNQQRMMVPAGIYGEIYIAGKGVARGYFKQPERSEEKFLLNICDEPGTCYRSGDLGRWLENGSIELLGRVDEQLKIRGHRIEPAEIEYSLTSHPSVKAAAVIGKPDKQGEMLLGAFIVVNAGHGFSKNELLSWIKFKLPAYMVPQHFNVLDKLPVTGNGKVDRKILAALFAAGTHSHEGIFEAPQTAMENKMAAIWKELLDVASISVTDNFFTSGGHSLKGNRLLRRISRDWGIDLNFNDLFEHPTIRELSSFIERYEQENYTYLEIN